MQNQDLQELLDNGFIDILDAMKRQPFLNISKDNEQHVMMGNDLPTIYFDNDINKIYSGE